MQRTGNTESKTNLKRHRHGCSVCNHEQCEEIERAFVGWASPAKIAEEYGIADRSSVYRHAHALGLFDARRKNVRAALEKLIERAGDIDVTASAVVAAVQGWRRSRPRACGLTGQKSAWAISSGR
jgi:hypothetical protein